MTEIKDWKGNEIKAGMTIYFVKTKPGFLETSRHGLLIPQTGETILEDEKNVEERKNREVWELGHEYLVEEKQGRLFYTTSPNEDGETYSSSFTTAFLFGSEPIIAIKGISDANPNE